MAPIADGPPCDILRMPYELLKRILAEVNQRDQLSIAKTCVHIWEVAYPMAYERIVVNVSPTAKESVLKNLASGVCLRYVKHLEIRSSPTATGEKPRCTLDLVAGMLLASLRRHQLLSFSMSAQGSKLATISFKNVVILLETQQRLRQVRIPPINVPTSFQFIDYLPTSSQLSNLREFEFQPSSNPNMNDQLSAIVRDLPNVEQLHFLCSFWSEDHTRLPWIPATRGDLSGRALFPLATRLTLRGYHFDWDHGMDAKVSFPALRAMAVVECSQLHNLMSRLGPEKFPQLIALNIKADEYLPHSIWNFLKTLHGVRELILESRSLYLDDAAPLTCHADSLQLLSLHNSPAEYEHSVLFDAAPETLKSLTALCHLSLFMDSVYCSMGTREPRRLDDETIEALNSCGSLRSLNLRCDIGLGFVETPLQTEALSLLDHGALFEESIGHAAIAELNLRTDDPESADTLCYLSVVGYCRLFPNDIHPDYYDIASGSSRSEKRMFKIGSCVEFRAAVEMRMEMLERYGKDGYYFLEEYIESMMQTSCSSVLDMSLSDGSLSD